MAKRGPILILTPLPAENKALTAALKAFAPKQLRCAVGGHGKVAFALAAQQLIQELKPRLIIGAGGAGALSPAVKLLDVVVAEAIVEHDFHMKFMPRPKPRFACEASLVEELRCHKGATKLHFGTLASGDEDIVDRERAAALHRETQALAVTWESAGLARAALRMRTPFLELRVVTDSASAEAKAEFLKNLQEGMRHLAAVIEWVAASSTFAD